MSSKIILSIVFITFLTGCKLSLDEENKDRVDPKYYSSTSQIDSQTFLLLHPYKAVINIGEDYTRSPILGISRTSKQVIVKTKLDVKNIDIIFDEKIHITPNIIKKDNDIYTLDSFDEIKSNLIRSKKFTIELNKKSDYKSYYQVSNINGY
ncbi:hypothetical protein ACKERC_02555 [Acinetobacter baumannii]|uniref:hypothetical protein n=1 Tax=Acinetobacter baumannii TaxID=470 RepID=UPI0038B48847